MDPIATAASTATNWQTVLIAGIGLASTIVSGIVAVLLARISANTRASRVNSDATMGIAAETRESAKATAISVEKVHVAVNSERTAMLEKLEALRAEILELSMGKAVADERAAVAKEHEDEGKA
jgi:hypothetical protein